ncbi:MAG: hypothetical protein WCI64_11410, partial [Chlorobium sp.]
HTACRKFITAIYRFFVQGSCAVTGRLRMAHSEDQRRRKFRKLCLVVASLKLTPSTWKWALPQSTFLLSVVRRLSRTSVLWMINLTRKHDS